MKPYQPMIGFGMFLRVSPSLKKWHSLPHVFKSAVLPCHDVQHVLLQDFVLFPHELCANRLPECFRFTPQFVVGVRTETEKVPPCSVPPGSPWCRWSSECSCPCPFSGGCPVCGFCRLLFYGFSLPLPAHFIHEQNAYEYVSGLSLVCRRFVVFLAGSPPSPYLSQPLFLCFHATALSVEKSQVLW